MGTILNHPVTEKKHILHWAEINSVSLFGNAFPFGVEWDSAVEGVDIEEWVNPPYDGWTIAGWEYRRRPSAPGDVVVYFNPAADGCPTPECPSNRLIIDILENPHDLAMSRLEWALHIRPGISPNERLLLIQLAVYADSAGRCSPTQSHLSDVTGIKDYSLRNAIKKLVAAGLVEIEQLGYQGRRNVYILAGVRNGWQTIPK